jgi:hypothetical protein
MLRTALLSAFFLLTASPARAQGIGSPLPSIELQGFAQTGARSLADFHGRALLIEFFAFW